MAICENLEPAAVNIDEDDDELHHFLETLRP
jgi:hypothetical protein